MRITMSSLYLATAYLALGARALPRPHPAATYQVVDVGGPSSSSASVAVVYETVAVTKSSKPETVTEAPLTVTVTPEVFSTTPLSSSAPASSSTTVEQESSERPATYSTSIEKIPIPTIPLSSSTWSAARSTTSASVIAFRTSTTTTVAAYTLETTSTWTNVAAYVPSSTTGWSEPATTVLVRPTSIWSPTSTWSPIPASIWSPTPARIWSSTPSAATHTVFETVFVVPSIYAPPAPVKSAFPANIVPWNATHQSGGATLSVPYRTPGLGAVVAHQTGALKVVHLAF